MGKTAVFVIVILERTKLDVAEADRLQSIVVVHTRELCHQIAQEFERFKAYLKDIKVSHLCEGGNVCAWC